MKNNSIQVCNLTCSSGMSKQGCEVCQLFTKMKVDNLTWKKYDEILMQLPYYHAIQESNHF